MAHAPANEMTIGPSAARSGASFQAFMLPRPGLARLGVIVLLFGIWEIAARFYVDKMFLSPPSNVFTSLQNVLMTNGVPAALRITFFELSVAFALSIVIGLAVGLAVGLSRFSTAASCRSSCFCTAPRRSPSCRCSFSISASGPRRRSRSGSPMACSPIMVTVVAGVQNIKPILLTSAKSMGASRWHIFRWVIFPHMIPASSPACGSP